MWGDGIVKRRAVASLGATFVLLALMQGEAAASFQGFPRLLKQQIERLRLSEPTLAPMAHTRFCLQYPADCRVRRTIFRGGAVELTAARWEDLKAVNLRVNRAIRPHVNTAGVAAERWLISPPTGDCNDYAVTKRHELIQRGWPARALLLAEVGLPSGDGHLVLVIRTRTGDLVADNLTPHIKPWSATRYRFVRLQSPRNPLFWSTVATN